MLAREVLQLSLFPVIYECMYACVYMFILGLASLIMLAHSLLCSAGRP